MNNYELRLTEYDFKIAKEIYEEELVNPINFENIFKALIYVILSATERHDKQIKIYENLLRNNLDNPKNIINNKGKLEEIISKIRYPNHKIKSIYRLSEWWLENENDLPKRIIEDINNKRKNEFELREEIAKKVPGIGQKCASLFMSKCGYENSIPVDLWILRALGDLGHDVQVPNYKTNRGPAGKEYIRCENLFREISKEYKVSPIIFQCALWGKYSTWKNKKRENLNQLKIWL